MLKKKLLGTVMIAMLALPAGAMAENNETSGEVDLTDALTNEMVTPFKVEEVGGGSWNHGVLVISLTEKRVYSNYQHRKKEHRASCYLGSKYDDSGWKKPEIEATSSVTGGILLDTFAYWDVR